MAMNHDPHSHPESRPPAGSDTPVDAGSQALAEALRSSFRIVQFVMFILIVVFLASGFFQVGPQQRAVILRFGKPVGEGQKALLGPGLHFGFPAPNDEVRMVSISGVQQVRSSVGWWAETPAMRLAGNSDVPVPGNSLNPAVDGYVITADTNIVHVSATLLYHIDDPIRYIFDFESASNVIQNALDNALVYSAARFRVDDILTRDKFGFQEAVRQRATELLDARRVGVVVERCEVESKYPRQQAVREAFVRAFNAETARSTLLQGARTYENQVLSRAQAEATSLTNVASTARAQMVTNLAAQAKWFSNLLPLYQANPELFVNQRLNETMSRVLTNVSDKLYVPERADGKPWELRLLLNREPPKSITGRTNQ